MATGNFYKNNASNYFVVQTSEERDVHTCAKCDTDHYYDEPQECDYCGHKEFETKTEHHSFDEWQLDDIIENLQDGLNGIGYQVASSRKFEGDARYLATKHVDRKFGDMDIGFHIHVILRYGYYEGANVDFIVTDNQDDEYNSIGEIPDAEFLTVEDWSEHSNGWVAMSKPRIKQWVSRTIEDEINKLEQKLNTITTPYKLAYRFSNGETGYKQVVHTN